MNIPHAMSLRPRVLRSADYYTIENLCRNGQLNQIKLYGDVLTETEWYYCCYLACGNGYINIMEHIFTIHKFTQVSLLRFIITKRKIRNYEKYLEIVLQQYVYDDRHKRDINTAFLTMVQDAELFDNASALLKYLASVIDINDALCQIGQTVETFGLSIRNVEKVYNATRFLIMNGATDHKDINYDIVFRLLCNGVDVNDTNEYATLIKADKEKRCSCIEKYLNLFAMCDVHNIKNIIADYVEYEHNYNIDF